jgi:hypothetical protein
MQNRREPCRSLPSLLESGYGEHGFVGTSFKFKGSSVSPVVRVGYQLEITFQLQLVVATPDARTRCLSRKRSLPRGTSGFASDRDLEWFCRRKGAWDFRKGCWAAGSLIVARIPKNCVY